MHYSKNNDFFIFHSIEDSKWEALSNRPSYILKYCFVNMGISFNFGDDFFYT